MHRTDDFRADLLHTEFLKRFAASLVGALGDPAIEFRVADDSLDLGYRFKVGENCWIDGRWLFNGRHDILLARFYPSSPVGATSFGRMNPSHRESRYSFSRNKPSDTGTCHSRNSSLSTGPRFRLSRSRRACGINWSIS